jgi:prepilin-type N-terminal cleavage/methylation domain-containing protein
MRRLPGNHSIAHRSGFSLVELLVVIVILGILAALILPAIVGARRSAQVAEVANEIRQLETAVTKFKSTFNVDPPSSLYIPDLSKNEPWSTIDRAKIRALWPQFNFSSNGGAPLHYHGKHLNGAECLVFFLGGVSPYPYPSGPNGLDREPFVPVGFSKNPSTPFLEKGTNRETPPFEFPVGRFTDLDNDGLPELLDPLPSQKTPYLFLSSQGRAYTKVNNPVPDDYDVHPSSNGQNSEDLMFAYFTVQSPYKAHRPDGYQIISPGFDGVYGAGGSYTDATQLEKTNRTADFDNITNFSGGLLKP